MAPSLSSPTTVVISTPLTANFRIRRSSSSLGRGSST
jgi:hypothetical protein